MKRLETYKEKYKPSKILEDKIMKLNDFDLTKYNGTKLVTSIMEWLRVYSEGKEEVIAPLQKFYDETKIDKNQFLTFVQEMDKTGRVENFKISIDDDNIKFYDFQNTKKDRVWEENEKV
ncbi:hypothetical protein M0Q50_01260 [bacterium]|jgi:hypothetical protein|nr:hypothetical protein [bacterium]